MKRKSTTTSLRDEVAITAIIASASLENQPFLKKFDATLKTLLADAHAQGHRPPETAEEFVTAMDSIEGFMLAGRYTPERTMESIELLEQLFTDSRKFPVAHLTQLGKALQAERKRIAALATMLSEVSPEVSFKVFEEHANITKNEVGSVLAVVRRDLEHFDGAVDDRAAFTAWITSEVEAEIAHRADICASERMRHAKFVAMHAIGKKAIFAGAWEVLKTCFDLGATRQEAEEVAQQAWCKIWENFAKWEADGTASIATRLRAFGRSQALGWRTERLRSRARFRRLVYVDLCADERWAHDAKLAA